MNISSALWAIWYGYWIISARNRIRDTQESSAKREPAMGRFGYMGLMMAGFALLIWPVPVRDLEIRLWPSTRVWVVAGLAIQAAGLAFAIWARHTLGKNWTARITTGGSQELVIRGPYKIVRHPIYTGLLYGVLGTAIVVGQVRALVGLVMVLAAVLIKLRREEAALHEHFGTSYEEYSHRVSGLVPGLPKT